MGTPYRHILVGIDGSAEGRKALDHATALAKATGATLRIVHVVDMGWLPIETELAFGTVESCKARRIHGEALLASGGDVARDAGVTAETRLAETTAPGQKVAAVLISAATDWPADIVVLGSRGSGAVERLLLGSVADGVSRRSLVPVLLVH